MQNPSKGIAYSCLAVLVALYVVGAVSNGSLRHEVQTLPLWFPIVLGFRQKEFAKWSALPCLFLWLAIMVLIWLFLLGWAHILTGHYSAIEISHDIGDRYCLFVWHQPKFPLEDISPSIDSLGNVRSVRGAPVGGASGELDSLYRQPMTVKESD